MLTYFCCHFDQNLRFILIIIDEHVLTMTPRVHGSSYPASNMCRATFSPEKKPWATVRSLEMAL